jgi:LPXTG-site transpeptidase (sortase) family protein
MTGIRARRSVIERVGVVPFACVIAALLLVSVSGLVWNVSPYWGRGGGNPAPKSVAGGSVGFVPVRTAAASLQLSPDRVEIPKLSAEAPIVKVGTTADDELDIPLNPKVVGWWSPGAQPGARRGTAVLAGHINYAGVTGTLSAIGTLRPGDRVLVFGHHRGKHRELTFRVTRVRMFYKTHLPYENIFDQHIKGRLALVTCGGPFDASTGNYLENVVVYATPASHHAKPLVP